jgi:hypothetical protein
VQVLDGRPIEPGERAQFLQQALEAIEDVRSDGDPGE